MVHTVMLSLVFGVAFAGSLDQAREARLAGNYSGAASLLDALHPLVEPDEEGAWQLERGLAEELSWHPELAEPYYRAAIDVGGEASLEARYHLVVVLDDMGKYPDARTELGYLRNASNLAAQFVPILDVQAGVIDLHTGFVRRGAHQIDRALQKVAVEHPHPWMEGRGRFALLDAWSDAADDLGFTGSEGSQKRNLKRRVGLLKDVESELYATIKTDEPEWIVASLYRVGRAYADLADDLTNAAPPRRLDADQVAEFRSLLQERAEAPRTKAYNCYDHGVSFALRLGFENPTVAQMRAARDELAKVR